MIEEIKGKGMYLPYLFSATTSLSNLIFTGNTAKYRKNR